MLVPNAAALYDTRRPTYGRAGLAAQETLMSALAELEGARAVKLFPSGVSALAGAMLAVLKAGDEVLVDRLRLQAHPPLLRPGAGPLRRDDTLLRRRRARPRR